MKIYPVPGRLVRDPVTGREVTAATEVHDHDTFWIRRLADGDVSLTDSAMPSASQGVD